MPTRLPARFAALGTRLRQMHASPTPGAGVAFVLLLGGGGGYYGYNRYGGPGIGGALGLVLIIILCLWFFGGLRI